VSQEYGWCVSKSTQYKLTIKKPVTVNSTSSQNNWKKCRIAAAQTVQSYSPDGANVTPI